MIDYDFPIYPIRDAAKACGFEIATLRSYFQRGHFKLLGSDREAEGNGHPRFFSLRTILGLAVTHRLWRKGAEPWLAFRAGQNFAHVGSATIGAPDLAPAHVYDVAQHGFTALLWYDADVIKVVPVPMRGGIDFATLFTHPQTGGRCDPTVVLLNDVERDVFSALNIGSLA